MLAEPTCGTQWRDREFLAGGSSPSDRASNGTITVSSNIRRLAGVVPPCYGRASQPARPAGSQRVVKPGCSLAAGEHRLLARTRSDPAITVRRADTTVGLGSGQVLRWPACCKPRIRTPRGRPISANCRSSARCSSQHVSQQQVGTRYRCYALYVGPVSVPGGVHTPTDDFVPAATLIAICFFANVPEAPVRMPGSMTPRADNATSAGFYCHDTQTESRTSASPGA